MSSKDGFSGTAGVSLVRYGRNDFSHRQTAQQSAPAIRMGRNKSAPEAFRKTEKGRLVVHGAGFDSLMHQCAFEEAVRGLNLTACHPTANRFVRA